MNISIVALNSSDSLDKMNGTKGGFNGVMVIKGDQKIMSKIVFLTFRGLLVVNSWFFFCIKNIK